MTEDALFDPGLQPERTELAWRRTALAVGVGSLVALRLLPAHAQGTAALVLSLLPGVLGLMFAAGLIAAARARYRRLNRALAAESTCARPGGGLLFAVTLFVLATAVAGIIVIAISVVH